MTHICVGKLTTIASDNGLSPGRRQAIIWTNAGISLIGPLGTNFSESLIGIQTLSFKKMHLKMSSAKWRPFCLGLNDPLCDEAISIVTYRHKMTSVWVHIIIIFKPSKKFQQNEKSEWILMLMRWSSFRSRQHLSWRPAFICEVNNNIRFVLAGVMILCCIETWGKFPYALNIKMPSHQCSISDNYFRDMAVTRPSFLFMMGFPIHIRTVLISVPSGKGPLPEPMLTKFYDAIRRHYTW